MKVLAVDDEQKILTLIAHNLRRASITVKTLSSSSGVYDEVKSWKPVVLLLDINMPIKDGFMVCKEIKSDPETKNTLIFMLSARTQLGDVEKAIQLGADDYLLKPFDALQLADKIRDKVARLSQTKLANPQR